MSTQDDNDKQDRAVVWAVLIGAVLLAVGLAIGMGLYRTLRGAGAAGAGTETAAALPGAGAGAAAGAAAVAPAGNGAEVPEGASIRVENGVVKFYFATGSAELAQGAPEALGDVVKGVAAGKKAIISGYHDVTGGQAVNEELSKQRAFAVRDALLALGIGEDKLELRKPADTTATGSNAEARRVEVTLE